MKEAKGPESGGYSRLVSLNKQPAIRPFNYKRLIIVCASVAAAVLIIVLIIVANLSSLNGVYSSQGGGTEQIIIRGNTISMSSPSFQISVSGTFRIRGGDLIFTQTDRNGSPTDVTYTFERRGSEICLNGAWYVRTGSLAGVSST